MFGLNQDACCNGEQACAVQAPPVAPLAAEPPRC
jgi:hypothetical protein